MITKKSVPHRCLSTTSHSTVYDNESRQILAGRVPWERATGTHDQRSTCNYRSASRNLTVSIERARAQAQQAYLLYSGGEKKQEFIHDRDQRSTCMAFRVRTVESRWSVRQRISCSRETCSPSIAFELDIELRSNKSARRMLSNRGWPVVGPSQRTRQNRLRPAERLIYNPIRLKDSLFLCRWVG